MGVLSTRGRLIGFGAASLVAGGQPDTPTLPDPAPPDASKSWFQRRAEADGLDIDRVKYVSRMSEIDCQAHTVYAVSGPLEYDAPLHASGVRHCAVVGNADATVRLPPGTRSYDIDIEGDHFLWAGIDPDQRAPGAWWRVNAAGNHIHFEDITVRGKGRRANPTPGRKLHDRGFKSGPCWHVPATSGGAVNHLKNVTDVHGGVFPVIHFGDRPSGCWFGPEHKGTLRVINCRIEEYPNNGFYCSACPGSVELENSRIWNNGVTQVRLAHGHIKNCELGFDYRHTGLGDANQPRHATKGFAAEQKNAGANGDAPPDVINSTIRMINVARCGGGVNTYDIHRPAKLGTVKNTDIHVESGAGRAADLSIPGFCEGVENCDLSGSAGTGVSVLNVGHGDIPVSGTSWHYPDGRRQQKGSVRWR